MSPFHYVTPCIESDPLSELVGCPVYLKMESAQPSGSFKNRGIGHYCQVKAEAGAQCLIVSSPGNAGLACAYSGRQLGLPVTVVIPKTTPMMMVDKISAQEAEVIVHGDNWNQADAFAHELAQNLDACYVPPFDDPLIWEGHASMIHELAEQMERPDAVVLSVGGGGLMSGVCEGLHDVGWSDVPIIAVETEGAASLAAAIKAGKPVELDHVDTVASSLAARRVAERAFEWTKEHPITSLVISDGEAVEACLRFADDHRTLVEPSCGAALAPVYANAPVLKPFTRIAVIVCGGCIVNLALLSKWHQQFSPIVAAKS